MIPDEAPYANLREFFIDVCKFMLKQNNRPLQLRGKSKIVFFYEKNGIYSPIGYVVPKYTEWKEEYNLEDPREMLLHVPEEYRSMLLKLEQFFMANHPRHWKELLWSNTFLSEQVMGWVKEI